MEKFKRKYGKAIVKAAFFLLFVSVIYPFVYWVPRPYLTSMEVALNFWYLLPVWFGLFFAAFYFDEGSDIYV